ncbi:hypothetical protein T02_932 [Trichinella nativa]|uniref:CCHC-type domain-containing protein n=1 Tax=Trichinella nativa TaxID=6335 RepID=A0A0V1KY64_9BILA|nr:hypothetical protein T02_932 [Trichinella nativa]
MNRAPDGATNGERGRMSENPRWIMPPEALTRSSDVERCFHGKKGMERYFRAAVVPDNRRGAMVQYHMDEAIGDVLSAMEVEETVDYDKLKSTLFRVFGVNNSEERYMKEFINQRQRENESVEEYAGHLKRLLPKAFPQLKEQADDILLQQFKAGIRQDMIKLTILRSAPDSFEKADLGLSQILTRARAIITDERPVDALNTCLSAQGPGVRSPTAPPGQWCFECGGPNHFAKDCLARRQDGDPEKRAQDRGISASLLSLRPLTEALPAVRMNVGGIRRRVLVDTGCSVCVVHASCFRSWREGTPRNLPRKGPLVVSYPEWSEVTPVL